MPDTTANPATYPRSPARAPGLGFPLARMVVPFCPATGAVLEAAIGRDQGNGAGAVSLFRSLRDGLDDGDVVLGDRCFGRSGRTDHAVTWERPQRPDRMDQTTSERIPEALEVRELRVQVA